MKRKVWDRTIQDQLVELKILVEKKGLDSLRVAAQYRLYCNYWMGIDAAHHLHLQEELKALKKNYDFVCQKLLDLEKEASFIGAPSGQSG